MKSSRNIFHRAMMEACDDDKDFVKRKEKGRIEELSVQGETVCEMDLQSGSVLVRESWQMMGWMS